MTPEEFRANGHLLVDWIARYLDEVGNYPVLSQVQPGDIRAKLPTSPPSSPEPFTAVLDDIDGVIMPGITHWQSPNFFAYFPANRSPVSILGELLSAGLGVQGMSWATSPSATELETHVLDWMVELLDLPAVFVGNGVIQDSASSATLCAILAARDRARAAGASIETLVGYASSQAHSSIEKGLRIGGIPADRFRKVDIDDAFAMRPEALAAAIAADRADGLVPFFVCAAAGATSTLAFDPVAEIAAITKAATEAGGIWLHVDAAMSGIAALCPEFRWVNNGVEHADSYCTNAHKWMGVNFDCTLFYVADRGPLLDALSILPPFLRTAQTGSVIDYRDWQVPLGRRFRALKLWFVLRCDGVEAIAAMVRDHIAWTEELSAAMAGDDRFEIVAPVALSLLVFRLRGGDEATAALIGAVKASGRADLTQTIAGGKLAVRVSIGSRLTERRHVQALWELLQEFAG
ncbi:MAG: pyridoxal-dependent decarboxylase [Acidimicrobiales bacterium]